MIQCGVCCQWYIAYIVPVFVCCHFYYHRYHGRCVHVLSSDAKELEDQVSAPFQRHLINLILLSSCLGFRLRVRALLRGTSKGI
jgi:hypothetical protein